MSLDNYNNLLVLFLSMHNYYCTVIMIVDTVVKKEGELAYYTGLLLSRSEVGVRTRLGGSRGVPTRVRNQDTRVGPPLGGGRA